MPATKVKAEEFVRIWQMAESITEVSQKTGLRIASSYTKAKNLRAKGVPLKSLSTVERQDYEALKALAISLNGKHEDKQ